MRILVLCRPSNVMATAVKIPTPVHLVLPPEKLDINVFVGLKNSYAKFEQAGFECGAGN